MFLYCVLAWLTGLKNDGVAAKMPHGLAAEEIPLYLLTSGLLCVCIV
jgi:hypothetical protein